jgi:hypothetical protein
MEDSELSEAILNGSNDVILNKNSSQVYINEEEDNMQHE